MRRQRPRRGGAHLHGGFTLVEVLVALVVMAIMAVMAWQGVDGIVRTRNASQARLESALRLNTVIAQWDQDLASLQDNLGVPDAIDCNGASVRILRRTPDGLQLVVWTLRPADDNTSNWERWASPAVTNGGELKEFWLLSQQLQGSEPASLRALTGLSSWKVYFYQSGAWANCQSTSDQGSTPANGTTPSRPLPPDGVRIVLSFAPGSGTNGDLTRDTLLKR
ncbi:MAG TPA: prepilin-type N-terminal cleavage/methylation domain-containing protein [Burkholderiaceae bacterium]|jgi:general secretion pathway protein J